jgi:ATP-binding cassette, subfamily C, bacterial
MKKNLICLWNAFITFYKFKSWQQTTILCLMLLQGISAGIGLLFIIPLLQIIGFETGASANSGIADMAGKFFNYLDIQINLINILISYVLIISLIASIRYQLSVRSTKVQQKYICFLRNQLYRKILHSHWQFIVQHKMSDFTHCLSGQVQAIGHASYLMLNLLSQIMLIVVMMIIAFFLSWKMTLLAIGFIALLALVLMPLNRIIYGSGKKQLLNFKFIFQMLTEHLGSLKMIKSYASEHYYANKLQHVSEALEAQQVIIARINSMTQWLYMVGTVAAFSVFFYVSHEVLALPLATMLLLLVVFSRLMPQLSGLQRTFQQLLHKVPAFNDVNDMMSACDKAQEPNELKIDCPLLINTIRLVDISYQYPTIAEPVFIDLNIEILKNQTTALTGPSGAGKSTLADLVAGLLEPNKGSIYCDDTLLENENRLAWRQRVAYVTQEVYLFHDTIRANLQWVSTDIVNDEALWQVLELAAAAEFVKRLPNGLNTVVGDQGIRLSGGERQRLALARALLSDPQLLILDEATSALDHDNETKIQLALEQLQGKLTILIIAHRESTIANADNYIVLSR